MPLRSSGKSIVLLLRALIVGIPDLLFIRGFSRPAVPLFLNRLKTIFYVRLSFAVLVLSAFVATILACNFFHCIHRLIFITIFENGQHLDEFTKFELTDDYYDV